MCCYISYCDEGFGRAGAPPSLLLAVPLVVVSNNLLVTLVTQKMCFVNSSLADKTSTELTKYTSTDVVVLFVVLSLDKYCTTVNDSADKLHHYTHSTIDVSNGSVEMFFTGDRKTGNKHFWKH